MLKNIYVVLLVVIVVITLLFICCSLVLISRIEKDFYNDYNCDKESIK